MSEIHEKLVDLVRHCVEESYGVKGRSGDLTFTAVTRTPALTSLEPGASFMAQMASRFQTYHLQDVIRIQSHFKHGSASERLLIWF